MEIKTLEKTIDASVLLDTVLFEKKHPGKLNDKDIYGYIYKVINKENGKIYIGKTKDIKRRAREYIIAATNPNLVCYKSFCKIIANEGLEKFIMEPIDFDYNKKDLAIKELDYILSYNVTDPAIGYNTYTQSIEAAETVNQKPRVQHADELMKRSKLVCCINIKTNYMLFSTGLKLFGTTISRKKDEVKSAAKRCATLDDFMIYYINNDDYIKQLEFMMKHLNKKFCGNTIDLKTFVKYHEYIVNYINNNENPEGFTIRFIHQSDDTDCKYEYETDLADLRDYCKNLIMKK
jgi:hypothetical protein